MNISMPDITQAQVISAVTWVVAQIVSWGWINNDNGQLVLSASSSFVAFAWILGDAVLRGHRAQAHAVALAAGRDLKTGKPLSLTN